MAARASGNLTVAELLLHGNGETVTNRSKHETLVFVIESAPIDHAAMKTIKLMSQMQEMKLHNRLKPSSGIAMIPTLNRRQLLLMGAGATLIGATPRWTGAASAPELTNKSIDIEPIVQAAVHAVTQARLAPGVYARFLGGQRARRPQGGAANPYGTAAAACILHAAGHMPGERAERDAFIAIMRAGQSKQTGLFSEPHHNTTHATAYMLAALELFDAPALVAPLALQPLLAPGAIEALLDGLDWKKPWGASHQGAGAFAALFISGVATPAWQERYFSWLWNEQDPVTGLWRKGMLRDAGQPEGAVLFDALAASFHYLFNHVAARRPLRYPEAMIDSALRVRKENLYPALGGGVGFAELDWLYCMTRPLRQCGHRHAEVLAELRAFTHGYAHKLLELVARAPTPFEDLHALNGTMAALAELQQTLPGLLRSERPLKLTLDRRPFI